MSARKACERQGERRRTGVGVPRADVVGDGVHAPVPREEMCEAARKLRDTYARVPGIPLFKREFGFYSLEAWHAQGMPEDADLTALFDYDPPGNYYLGQLGWCEAAFQPAFEVKVLDVRENQVKIGVNAPREITVHRLEVYQAIQKENLEALSSSADVRNIEDIIPQE